MGRFLKYAALGIAFFLGIFTAIAFVYNVPETITDTDKIYIGKMLEDAGYKPEDLQKTDDFNRQITTVLAVQDAVFKTSPHERAIALNTPREPEDLYKSDHGYCFDRARSMEKMLRSLGFETRYAALFENEPGRTMLQTMLTPASPTSSESHALVEVKTDKGWLIVDTRARWISLTKDGDPVSLKQLREKGYDAFTWSPLSQEPAWQLLHKDYYIFYGLYSRHGQFYPPYTKYIPDVNWSEMLYYGLIAP